MKFLITGGSGMLAFAIKKEAEKIDGASILSCGKDECDITDMPSIRMVFADFKPDFVINCAAYTAVDKAEEDIDGAMAVNAAGAHNIALLCVEFGATLVHFSTDYVFDGKKQSYDEDDVRDPINAYGLSKAKGEEAIESLLSGGKFYIIRTAWLYGPHGPNFVETMLRLAGEKDSLSVVNDQHGSPTLTFDLSKAVLEILTAGPSSYPYGIYHLTNAGNCTWYEYTKSILEFSNITIPVNPVTSAEFPRPARRPTYSVLNNNKGPKLRTWQAALDYFLKNLR